MNGVALSNRNDTPFELYIFAVGGTVVVVVIVFPRYTKKKSDALTSISKIFEMISTYPIIVRWWLICVIYLVEGYS